MLAPMKNDRLLGIQMGRGIAALLVAVYHATRMMDLPQYAGHKGFGGVLEFGYAGVDFFFVLSGFIIYFVHHRDLGRAEALGRYAWRRVARIFPNYWLITAPVFVLALIKHDPDLTAVHTVKALFLFPDSVAPILGVAWTLVYEMLFYCAFALAIANAWLGFAAAIAWMTWVVAVNSGAVHPHDPFLVIAGSILNLQFLLGLFAARMVLDRRVPYAKWLALAGAVAFVGAGIAEDAGLFPWTSSTAHMIFAVCSMVIIAGLATAEQEDQIRVGAIGELFGGASYLLYLVHILVIGVTLQALRVTGLVRHLQDFAIVGITVTAAFVFAAFLYRFFDLPVHRILSRLGREHVYGPPVPRIARAGR